MDLTKHWAFKHGFLHACGHRPKQPNASGKRESVSNHGLAFAEGAPVFHLCCSVKKISRLASAAGNRSVRPEGQRTSIQSTCVAVPKPKCRRLSLFER